MTISEACHPHHLFGTIGYPLQLTPRLSTCSILRGTERITPWRCVNDFKAVIMACSRGLLWKSMMCSEVENLALQVLHDPFTFVLH